MKSKDSSSQTPNQKDNKGSKHQTFSAFLSDPMIAGALLVFAFIALVFSLHDFLNAKGF